MHLLTGFGLGCLSLLCVILVRDFRHSRMGRVFLMIVLTSFAFLIDPLMPRGWHWLTSDLQTALPGLFWLLCEITFARRPRLLSPWAAMALYTFLAPAIARPFVTPDAPMGPAVFFGWTLGRYLEYVIVLRGFWHVVSHWRDDLVEARRRARLLVLLVVGGAVGWAAVSMNTGLSSELTPGLVTGVAAFLTAVCLIHGRQGVLEVASGETEPTPPASVEAVPGKPEDPEQDADAIALAQTMAAGYYRTERLTLAMLSAEAGIPEYRLRRVINRTLGYRNFNDYINQLRIAEAASRLRREPDTPVLNISLDVGYRTLSSFNRAFREIQGVTPTAYRQGEAGEGLKSTLDPA
ncbi:AraC family transcriptional regulator [Marinobacter mangrovi]|uniref:AraC family transcriptional regulator n=1 Tax=Marinobacter mangrovi TaxID=2803918 RepID=UPI002E2B644D|nr:helix-turn-helix domain-containing protein [Marinobacter mangrovi]